MKLQTVGALTGALLVAMGWGCSASHSDDEDFGTTALGIGSWTGSVFNHILAVSDGQSTVRNRCTLTIPLTSARPLTIVSSVTRGTTYSSTLSAGWTGTAVSLPDLLVSGCSGYPCDVVVTRKGPAASGKVETCDITADDGETRLVASSSESTFTLFGTPTSGVSFNQRAVMEGTGISAACTLQQNEVVTDALVTELDVYVDNLPEVSEPSITVGDAAWPTKVPINVFGSLRKGWDATGTRLKHTIPASENLGEGTSLRYRGSFENGNGPVFDVNVSKGRDGTGMTLETAPTQWSCSSDAFGSADGCDCDCGVMDPDCGSHDCSFIDVSVVSSLNWTINGAADPTLELVKGRTYVFQNSSAHPFAIHSVAGNTSTGVRYNDGVVGQGVTNGSLKFTPPLTAPSTVHYQCELHSAMTGALNLLDP